MKILAIIQSRLDSNRLPNKGLLPINNIPLTVLVAKRVISKKYKTIVATTTQKSDDDLCVLLKNNNINYFRGSSNNVRKRFLGCCKNYDDEDIIVRLTSDNCFPDKNLIENLILQVKGDVKYTYIDNIFSKVPYGLSVEVFKLGYLRKKKINNKRELEHITLNFEKKNKFNYKSKHNMQNLRCTIDTVDDYAKILKIFKNVKDPKKVSWKKLCQILYKSNIDKNKHLNEKVAPSPKLILGCAQMGFKYGVTNKKKMTFGESKSIFKFCDKIGINHFDTASEYGSSEKIIGKNLKKKLKRKIDTKIYFKYKNLNKKKINNFFKKTIINSKKYLKNNINTLYLHNVSLNKDINNLLIKNFNYFKKKKFFLKKGVSFNEYRDFNYFYKNYLKYFNVIQLPINILDHRWKNRDLNKLKKENISIVARSIFLQGLLTSSDQIWPKSINSNSNNIKKKINFLVKKFNRLNFMDLCIAYVNSINNIDKIIIGVNSLKHLTKVYYLMNLPPLNQNQRLIVQKTFSDLSTQTIQPSKWKI